MSSPILDWTRESDVVLRSRLSLVTSVAQSDSIRLTDITYCHD
ncbi:MAG TPA: hypothetical protein V6D33_12065 [Cyanophyceae cyanobacterium]